MGNFPRFDIGRAFLTIQVTIKRERQCTVVSLQARQLRISRLQIRQRMAKSLSKSLWRLLQP